MSSDLRRLAADIAIEAANLALEQREAGVRIAAEKSTPVDIVTDADRATELFIRERLNTLRPNDAIVGEEGGGVTGTSGLTWLVDPIDGTVNYLYDIPEWAVSLAVVEGDPEPDTWTALAGAVINPRIGEVFSAHAGGGATLNDRPITASTKDDLATALIGTGFAYSADVRSEQGVVINHLIARVRDIRRIGACSLDLCAVASGRFDAYFERTVAPWDHAAGALIAREAGAIVSGYPGKREGREFLIASNQYLYEPLMSMILDAGASSS